MQTTADIDSRPSRKTERAYQQGYDACVLGARLEENPYADGGGENADLWHRGWLAAYKLV